MTAAPTMGWMTPWGQLAWLRAANEGIARQFYNLPTSYVVGGNPFPGAPPYWACKVLPLFATFEDYAAAGASMAGAKFPLVCADFENWPKTSAWCKQHPAAAFAAFASLAQARGQQVVAAPSRDIIYAPGADMGWQWPETINDGYLRCQIPAVASAHAAMFICQSQGSEKDLVAFGNLLRGAYKQLPAGVDFWAELTTNFATGAQMKAAYDTALTCGVPVAGFWVVVADQSQAQVAVDFFRLVAGN